MMCRVLQVSGSAYYEWLKSPLSARAREDLEILNLIRKIYKDSDQTYGSPKVHAALRDEHGVRVGCKRVARLMRQAGFRGVCRQRKFQSTTKRDPEADIAEDLVNRDFSADAPDKLWVGDITEVRTDDGKLFLAVVLDVFGRRVVGWAMSSRMPAELVDEALQMALFQRQVSDTIHHSDHGSQYTSDRMRKRCSEAGLRVSMGSVGDCYDNAMIESFFASLECEVLKRHHFDTRQEAERRIFQYIEGWYNTRRLHSALGYKSPCKHEERYWSAINNTNV